MRPTLSIVTPSFNQGRFLQRTIESVLTQSVPADEYVVMDGGSTDESVSILRRHEGRLRWTSERDRGQAHAVNKGLAVTRGEVIGWLNSDDVFFPDAFRAVLDVFTDHPEVDVVYGDGMHIDENDQPIDLYPTEEFSIDRLREQCFFCQPAVFFRRRVIDRCGVLDEDLHFSLDYEYWLRLADAGMRFARLPKLLAGSRLYASTKTLGSRRKVHIEINDMLRRRYGRTPGRWLLNYACATLGGARPRWLAPIAVAAGIVPVTLYACWRWNGFPIAADLGAWLRGLAEKMGRARAFALRR